MLMFNYTKIDKLTITGNRQVVTEDVRERIKNELLKHFPNATIYQKSMYFGFRFTPTKLCGRKRGYDREHNLQMPPEELLAEVLCDIFPKEVRSKMWVTELDTAIDLILKMAVQQYINMLANRIYPSELHTRFDDIQKLLTLFRKRNIGDNTDISFKANFYDKPEEYEDKHDGIQYCKLYEPLEEGDIEQVGDAYDPYDLSLKLYQLKWMRLEFQYSGTPQILQFIKAIDPKAEKLTLDMLIEQLKQGKLIATIDKVFREKLKKYMFYEDMKKFEEEVNANTSKNMYLICSLLKDDPEFYYFRAVANELGYKEQMDEIDRNVRKMCSESELYLELYNKLFPFEATAEAEEVKEVLTVKYCSVLPYERLISTCKSYCSKAIKDFRLPYKILLLDDT